MIMNTRLQLMCTWGGPLFVLFLVLGWWIVAGFVPPVPPTASTASVVEFYTHSSIRVQLGLFVTIAGLMFYIPWTAVISEKIADIEAPSRLLSNIQMACGALNVLLFGFPTMVWAVLAFRPERDPELISLLSDLAWIPFVSFFSPFIFIPICIATAAFMDKGEQPFFPRWSGFFNLWFALFIIPGGLAMIFKTGPFAWNGLLAFWVPLTVFFAWFVVMFLLLQNGIKRSIKAG